ncbi:MAG: hypothetical protein K2K53_03840, partial [Oscillospiraceae bacterium]|nr:hypothetical protein [Oscillospiraceae bacterium]
MPEFDKGGVKPEDFTDVGNAQLFRDYYRGLMVYTDALGWLNWNGKVWERGEHKAVTRGEMLTLNMLCDAYDELSFARQKEKDAKWALEHKEEGASEKLEQARQEVTLAQAYLAHAQRTRQAPRLNAMVDMAKHNMVVKAEQLDADPYLLNTPGGEADLRTGELKSHNIDSPFHYCTHITAANVAV